MFTSSKFYIIVRNNSFIIKREDDDLESVIELQTFIPHIPAYYHLFDEDKENYIKDIKGEIKRLKIKNATIIFPDDSIDLEVDKRVLTEFFLQAGVKKIQVNFQCFFLSFDKKYISVSKTARTLIMQYIAYNKSVSKRYYDKNYTDIEQIMIDIKKLHTECANNRIPVFINNINNDMEGFKAVGKLTSLYDITTNIMNSKSNN
jgi:DNA mismatch repair ATPase MutS